MPKKMKVSEEELKWRTESDARTLKEAELIKKDPKRMKAATAMMEDEMNAIHAAMGSSMEEMADKMYPGMKEKKEES